MPQDTLTAASSSTNEVYSLVPSVPVKVTVTVPPMKLARFTVCFTYPDAALRFDALSTVDPPTVTVNVSNFVVVVVSVPAVEQRVAGHLG